MTTSSKLWSQLRLVFGAAMFFGGKLIDGSRSIAHSAGGRGKMGGGRDIEYDDGQ